MISKLWPCIILSWDSSDREIIRRQWVQDCNYGNIKSYFSSQQPKEGSGSETVTMEIHYVNIKIFCGMNIISSESNIVWMSGVRVSYKWRTNVDTRFKRWTRFRIRHFYFLQWKPICCFQTKNPIKACPSSLEELVEGNR